MYYFIIMSYSFYHVFHYISCVAHLHANIYFQSFSSLKVMDSCEINIFCINVTKYKVTVCSKIYKSLISFKFYILCILLCDVYCVGEYSVLNYVYYIGEYSVLNYVYYAGEYSVLSYVYYVGEYSVLGSLWDSIAKNGCIC